MPANFLKGDFTVYFSKDLLRDNGLLFAMEKMTYIDSRTMPKMHYHDHYELLYVTENERILTVGSKSYRLNKNSVALIPPYIPHLTKTGGKFPEERILISFKWDFLGSTESLINKKLSSAFNPSNPVLILENAREDFSSTVNSLLSAYERNMSRERIALRLSEVLLVLCEISKNEPYDKDFEEILRFVENNFRNKITLELLAEKFYLNKFTILRKFQKHTGMGLPKYLNTIRIINAKRELMGNGKVIDIAFSLGFGSTSAFDRAFLSEVGMTPREYRNTLLMQERK